MIGSIERKEDSTTFTLISPEYVERLEEENKQLKEELQQFQYDFEKQEAEVFNELEQAINELDLSDKTKEYLIDLMNKDVNIVFGIVEDKIQELKEKYK